MTVVNAQPPVTVTISPTSASVSGALATYTYDGDGKRASATTDGLTTRSVYDVAGGLPVLLAEYDSGGNLLRKYAWGPAGLHASADGSAVSEKARRSRISTGAVLWLTPVITSFIASS